jgi:hypothetical protein
MRNIVVAMLAVTIAGCEGAVAPEPEPIVTPLETRIERTYRVRGCLKSGPQLTTALPCITSSSGSMFTVADSGRLDLHKDGTGRWMIAFSSRGSACYSSPSCAFTSVSVDTSAATYRIMKDSIVVNLIARQNGTSAVAVLYGDIPDLVPTGWNGPDSLSYPLYVYLGLAAVLKP